MAAEGDNVEPNLLQAFTDSDHGHYFVKKNFAFGRSTYCHHCCEVLWGMLSTGYSCEVCNFTCHERCLTRIASYCSGVALQLVKNPVAHTWAQPSSRPKFCCVCRKRTDPANSLECEICEYYVHSTDCQDLAVSDCREATTFGAQTQHHHWREGNLPVSSECPICRRSCYTSKCLAGMRCEWCGVTAHASCYRQIAPECDLGVLKKIMLPPCCLTIPRTELSMEMLLNLHKPEKEKTGTAPPPTSTGTVEPDGSSLGSSDDAKDKEGCDPFSLRENHCWLEEAETLRIYDGNNSLANSAYRTASVPKNATLQQIKESALRSFHILDHSDNYFLTQALDEDGTEEEITDDAATIRTLKKPDGKRAQILLRYRDKDQERTTIKVYGSWLRIPVTFCSLLVTKDSTVAECISESLEKFGLDSTNSDKYQLVEVSLHKGVAERIVDSKESVLVRARNLRNESLRRYQLVRFYLQEKEDPHGSNVSVFVANLPPNRIQRQYEHILLTLLGVNERPFTQIGPIYYEYGSMIVTFNSPKAATNAVLKLQNANYDNKQLLVQCLPNIEANAIPADTEPLVVFVNVRSGGGESLGQGEELKRAFRKLLNPFQVFDVLTGGPLVGLYVFRNVPKYRILACGGDGTVGWVLNCLDIAKQNAACFLPPCGIVPIGTGNDLARVLKWGGGYGAIQLDTQLDILKDVIEAEEVALDRWTVVFHEDAKTYPKARQDEGKVQTSVELPGANPEDATELVTMNNYFGIGIDADVALDFDEKRKKWPEKFSNRNKNKFHYFTSGLYALFSPSERTRKCKDLYKYIELDVEGQRVEVSPNIEGLIILNITSFASGCDPWGKQREEPGFNRPSFYDGKLEVVGVTGVRDLGMIGSKMKNGIRVAQGSSIRIITHETLPVEVDGEPKERRPGTITIMRSALKATMLKKVKTSKSAQNRRNTAPPTPSSQRATHSDGTPPVPPLSTTLEPPTSSALLGHGRSAPEDLGSTASTDDGDTFL